MLDVKVTYSGHGRVAGEIKAEMRDFVKDQAEKLEKALRRSPVAPRDTGTLRRSLSAQVTRGNIVVEADTDYAETLDRTRVFSAGAVNRHFGWLARTVEDAWNKLTG